MDPSDISVSSSSSSSESLFHRFVLPVVIAVMIILLLCCLLSKCVDLMQGGNEERAAKFDAFMRTTWESRPEATAAERDRMARRTGARPRDSHDMQWRRNR